MKRYKGDGNFKAKYNQGLWFIKSVTFTVPFEDREPVIMTSAPFEMSGSGWGTLVIEILIEFQDFLKKPPVRLEHELSFERKRTYQLHSVNILHRKFKESIVNFKRLQGSFLPSFLKSSNFVIANSSACVTVFQILL